MYQLTGYVDINKISQDAWPALVTDVSAGEQGITALAFGNSFFLYLWCLVYCFRLMIEIISHLG